MKEYYGRRKTYEESSFLTQANLFILDNLGFIILSHDSLAIYLVFGNWLASPIHFDKFLNTAIAACDLVLTFLHDSVFGLDFLQEMLDLSGKIRNYMT